MKPVDEEDVYEPSDFNAVASIIKCQKRIISGKGHR
jgi:hypothetical protein